MKRPHRRAHLLIWMVLTPLIAIAAIIVFQQSPPEPYANLEALPGNEAD